MLLGCQDPIRPAASSGEATATSAAPSPSVSSVALTPTPSAAPTAEPVTRDDMAKVLAGIQPGEERSIGGGTSLKMHRIQATKPIGGGWQLAQSTEGGFSVEVPLPFNDLRIRALTGDKVEMRSHTIGGKSPGMLAWSATCMVRRDGKIDVKPSVGGQQDIEPMGNPPAAYMRKIAFDDMSCVLVVEAQGTDPLPPEADRNRFLHSLKRTGKPTW